MARPKLSEMTLREKVGQTGMPGPGVVRAGVQKYGGYDNYLTRVPFGGIYLDTSIVDKDGNKPSSPEAIGKMLTDASNKLKIPMFVSCDMEYGAKQIFNQLHRLTTNMSVGASKSKELAFERGYYFVRELQTMGVNWPFGPVGDLVGNFFGQSVRNLGEDADAVAEIYPYMIKGMQSAGVGACAKHFPSGGTDYRDSHFCSTGNNVTVEGWNSRSRKVWQAAVDAGVMSFMTGHASIPAFDNSFSRGKIVRPASASSKVIDLLRKDLGFDGLIVTDAVCMKGLAAAFEHDDIYIECFNAGNDIILFVHDDYIDVMEKAVLDGRVSMERLDEAVERVLDLKEKCGLFDGPVKPGKPLTEEENKRFDEVNYGISQKALTLVSNENNVIPFNPQKVKKATIIKISPDKGFEHDLLSMKEAFENRGIRANIVDYIATKEQLRELADTEDIIVYACVPGRMSFYSSKEDLSTLFHSLSHGIEKTVVASFLTPSVYYNYFENAYAYINAYSSDAGTMRAFVDGILGDFEFTGKSPVRLHPIPIKK